MQKGKENLTKARVALQVRAPFFSYLVMHLTFIASDNIPFIGVDTEGSVYYSEDKLATLDREQTIGLVIHEALHVGLEHIQRIKSYHIKDLANIAMDLVVNTMLVQNGFFLPKEGLIPVTQGQAHGYEYCLTDKIKVSHIEQKSWEEIYKELESKMEKKEIPQYTFDSHMQSDTEEGEGPKDESKKVRGMEELEGQGTSKPNWKRVMNQAMAYAKLQGKAPAEFDRLFDELNFPNLNWRSILQRFVVQMIPYDFSYQKPSKRGLSSGFYLPSVTRDTLEVIVGIDTSGSITQDELTEYMSHLHGIIKAYENVRLTVIPFDAAIQGVYEVNNIHDFNQLKMKGGGGTSFCPLFKYVENNHSLSRSVILIFTDGYGRFPEKHYDNVLWILHKTAIYEQSIPFGQTIRVTDE